MIELPWRSGDPARGLRQAAAPALLVIAVLLPGSEWLQAGAFAALLLALGEVGMVASRWLLPGVEAPARATSAFALAAAFFSLLATLLGHFGGLARAPFLLAVAVASVAASLLDRRGDRRRRAARAFAAHGAPVEHAPRVSSEGPAGTPPPLVSAPWWQRLATWRRALLLAALLLMAAVGVTRAAQRFLDSPAGGPDDLSYHLPAAAVWSRFGDLRMLKFAMGDWNTVFYPILPELGSWTLLAPFGDSDVATRWSALPWAVFSLLGLAALGRRLGLSRQGCWLAVLAYVSVRRVLPLAFTAGNDHVAAFCTLAALEAALGAARRPSGRRFAYLGVCLGLLVASKYTGIFHAATVLLVLLAALAAGRRLLPPLPTLATRLALAAACALTVGGYTYARNAVTMGNPIFPQAVSLLGRELLPGDPGSSLAVRLRGPDAAIDLGEFLLHRPDLLGSLFTWGLLPASLLAPLLALARRRWLHALLLALPVAFFLQFLFLMHDHRDVRYFLAGLAVAGTALAWVLERMGRWGAVVAVALLVLVLAKLSRWLEGPSWLEVLALLACLALGVLLARWPGTRWSWTRAATPWLPLAAALLLATALGRGREAYHRHRFADVLPAVALEQLVGARGAAVAYVGHNTPYAYFGSRLQNDLRVVPRGADQGHEHYAWRHPVGHPRQGSFSRWRHALERRRVRFVVVVRGAAENPERRWMARRAGRGFVRAYTDDRVEIWRVGRAELRGRTRHPARAAGRSPS